MTTRFSFSAVAAAALAALLLFAGPSRALAWGTDNPALADEIAELMRVRPGATVAEIGAGGGAMSVLMAAKVGPAGRVYSTEIDPESLAEIRKRVAAAELKNVTAVAATATETGLPPDSCDGIFMIGVYHHLTEPAVYDRSILRALRPGATLVVSDFYPSWLLAPWATATMRKNFGGHGVAEPQLVEQLTGAGFRFIEQLPDCPKSWLLKTYCAVFRKPESSAGN
jgi:ubiquinone/menaquinone biosynthesis C-methylase UbiE